MNVALIQLPHFYGQGFSRLPESYPLGLGYISSFLSCAGITHRGIDLWGMQVTAEDAVKQVDLSGFDVFAISAYSTQYQYLKAFSRLLKAKYPDVPLICGGPGPTFSSEVILRNTVVDFCVIGEGEQTLLELLENMDDPQKVLGISFIRDGELCSTGPRPQIENLDELLFPNRELFHYELALRAGDRYGEAERRSADIIAGRGCPYRCRYCSRTFSGIRLRSISNVIQEIRHLQDRYGINHLLFNDELVLVGKKRTLELCHELESLSVTWACQGRINQVDREILIAMKKAGCVSVGYGVESVSQSILDRMDKGIKAESIVPVIQMTREVGIIPLIQYMFGYPGENDQTIKATVDFFKAIDHPYIGFTTTPIPGTDLYRDCMKNGLIVDEEDYLLRLDSGYNLHGSIINMTSFTDKEFLRKKLWLHIRVTHNYLKRRPLEYLRYILITGGRWLNQLFFKLSRIFSR